MKIIYFDLCSIPLYLLILWTCYVKKLVRGQSYRFFIIMAWVSLICAVLSVAMEFVVNPTPLTGGEVALGTFISTTYKLLRNSSLALYFLFIFSITRTEYRIRDFKIRALIWLPAGILAFLLAQNLFTHNVFIVTAETGYSRGSWLMIFYAIALLYGVTGTAYCIYCKRYLAFGKWMALISVYVLTFASVLLQLVKPECLVEMFCTSLGMLMILLLVLRPEETIDNSIGVQNWNAYQTDLRNILMEKEFAQILIVHLEHVQDVRAFLGEERFNLYLREIADELPKIYPSTKSHVNLELYFERPGIFYMILDDAEFDTERHLPAFIDNIHRRAQDYIDLGARVQVKIALVRPPGDMSQMEEIINFGHQFPRLGQPDQTLFLASEIVQSKEYEILSHIEEILNRAITEDRIEMYYQPIFHLKSRRFHSAEALARLKDSKYGMISPGVFIPAAEANGMIFKIGDIILESVFRFVSEHDLESLGLSYVNVNLSVSQMLQRDFPQTVERLQEEYNIDPEMIVFEITETVYDNVSDVMELNVRKLRFMGYSFSLDDYGVGYSNIQRMSKLPLSIVKIDKSLVDEMFDRDGRVIIHNTVRMMKGINKELVVEGVETKEERDILADMACDYIQGFYYSRPLPVDEFLEFLKKHNDRDWDDSVG